MSEKLDVNNYQGKLQREIANITERDDETGEWRVPREADRNDLILFADDLAANLSASTAGDDIARVRRMAEILDKPLQDCDVDDIKLAMKKLAEINIGEGETYGSGTRRKYLQAFERFGQSRGVEALSDIDVPSVPIPKVDADKYPTKSDFWEMIDAADSARDKAMIAVMWECPSRITAFLSLKIKDYETPNEEYGLLTTPTGAEGLKEADGQMKPVTISRGYLDRWVGEHPCKNDDEAALFCRMDTEKHYGEHMTDEAARKRLNRLKDKVGLDKPVHPHAFRHSRASYMKKSDKYDDMHIEQVMDWAPGSQQHRRYEHLKQTDKINSILRARGVEPEDDEMDPEDRDCPSCLQTIPWDARTCPYCSVRVDDAPADWWELYTRIVDDDDPVYKRYADAPAITPAFAALSPQMMKHVRHQMGRTVAISDYQESPYGDFSQDEIDQIAEMWLDYGAVAESAEANEAEWELMDDDEFSKEELEAYADGRPRDATDMTSEDLQNIVNKLVENDDDNG